MVIDTDHSNVSFSSASAPFSTFPNVMPTNQSTDIRETLQFKANQGKFIKRKAHAFRNLMISGSKSQDTPDNAIQEFCLSENLGPRMDQKFSNAGTSSSSESSPSSSSLRQRISTLENFGRNTLLKPKFLNMPSMLISSANRRWGGNKNGNCRMDLEIFRYSVLTKFRLLGLSKTKMKSPNVVKPIFEAESPDELALVETAYRYNVRLIKRSPSLATVIMPG